MGRWIGLDYGTRRVGIAVTDPLGLIASPHKTVPSDAIISHLHAYSLHEHVSGIVIGMPRTLDYKIGTTARLVQSFTRMLHRHLPDMPLYHHDERFTSQLAQASLLEAGVKKKKRRDKTLLDAMSATLILSSFLEVHKKGRSHPLTFF